MTNSKENKKQIFVRKSKEKYPQKFDYSCLVYKNMKTKVILRCIAHDVKFEVYPVNHLKKENKTGSCPKCKSELPRKSKVKPKLNNIECKNIDSVAANVIKPKLEILVERSTEQTKCTFNNCEYMSLIDSKWCGKHKRKGEIQEQIKNGIKYCSNWKRGCNNILTENYNFKRCEQCRLVEQKKSLSLKQRRKKNHEDDLVNGVSQPRCGLCGKRQDKDLYVTSQKLPTIKCQTCLEKGREREKKRPKRNRTEQYREYSKRPEVIARKNQWKADNPEKIVSYYKNYRKRKREKDPEKYLQHNAIIMKKWREKNPIKAKQIQEKHRQSSTFVLKTYKYSAKQKGIDWELTDEQVENMIREPCWYCESLEQRNGIDRLDPDGIYSKENCKTCCKECNYSKSGYTVLQYISQVARIAKYNLKKDTHLDKLCGPEINNPSSFDAYKKRAEKKNLNFNITLENYENITHKPCYLCGILNKQGSGIDRINNDVGYVLDNIKPCCGMCNCMKKDQNLQQFLNRCLRIVTKFEQTDLSKFKKKLPNRGKSKNKRPFSPDPIISRREKALIRNKFKNTNKKWIEIRSKQLSGKTTTKEDMEFLDSIEKQIQQEIQLLLKQKKTEMKKKPKKI